MNDMPDRPETWAFFAAWLQENFPALYAALLAAAIAAARLLNGGSTWRRIALEALICGLITLAASNGLGLLGIPASYSPLFGGFIGLIGAEGIREGLKRFYNRKADTL